jgi:hypothetical protein
VRRTDHRAPTARVGRLETGRVCITVVCQQTRAQTAHIVAAREVRTNTVLSMAHRRAHAHLATRTTLADYGILDAVADNRAAGRRHNGVD